MITPEQHAEIRRLYYGEHWKVGTIATALGVHHDTVRAAIANDTQGVRRGTCRATRLDPYLPLIRDTLAQYPRLRATRLFDMVKGRGYTGSVVQLRRAVRLIRPAATATVYRRLTTLAGEEAQVDWGALGSIRIGRGVRPLSGFVMVLPRISTSPALGLNSKKYAPIPRKGNPNTKQAVSLPPPDLTDVAAGGRTEGV
jgi:transposase